VIEVSGRLYPVEVRYRPVQTEEAEEGRRARSLRCHRRRLRRAESHRARRHPGLPARRARDPRGGRSAAQARLHRGGVHAPEILPLFARLSAEEQSRIFKPHSGRRIVLATNVAETSLTVPGIRYVVDSGLARVKRYSYRNKVEQLQVEKIAQASANQRAGRCGRVAAGVCIRLYDEAGFRACAAVCRSGNPALVAGRRHPAHEGAAPRRRRGFPFIEAPPPRRSATATSCCSNSAR
jgi:ATP-dependent helicase HrpA